LAAETRCYVVGSETDPADAKHAISRGHPELLVQTVRAETASNESFVGMICAETMSAERSQVLLARKPEIDLLLRLASTTQISVAIGKVGVGKGEPFLLIVAGEGKTVKAIRPPAGWKRLDRRPLSKGELELIERAALLNAARG